MSTSFSSVLSLHLGPATPVVHLASFDQPILNIPHLTMVSDASLTMTDILFGRNVDVLSDSVLLWSPLSRSDRSNPTNFSRLCGEQIAVVT